MKQPFRLDHGGAIDRSQALDFSFNGRALQGYAGDSLASALLANGVRIVNRSCKFHRPRGIYSAGEEEPNALLEVGRGAHREPSRPAPQIALYENLIANSQSGWPGVGFDLARVLDFTHRLWPAGFYNKTFKWPAWETWEGMVRNLSGLGRPLDEPDPDHYEQLNAHCDLLICGAGPAGLVAALVAGRAGLRVIVADQDRQFGGALNWERIELDDLPARVWLSEMAAELGSLPTVRMLPGTTVTGIYDHNVTTLLQRGTIDSWRECFWTVRPQRILLATGAIEQGLIFADNDRPGIMLASAVRHYLNRYAVAPGHCAVIATNNDSAYQTASDLYLEGLTVAAVIDNRVDVRQELREELQKLGVRLYCGARICKTRGARAIRSVNIQSLTGTFLDRVRCDVLGISGGWAPRVHLLCHARGALKFSTSGQCFLPDRLADGIRVIGSAAGVPGLTEIMSDALAASMEVCRELGVQAHHVHLPRLSHSVIESVQVGGRDLRPAKRRQWIDLAHDVTFADAELAVREGYDSAELFKRYTTAGMSIDQGKTSNLNAFLALSALTGKALDEIGTTTFRPPYSPVTLGAIAGRNQGEFYSAKRYLPAHLMHQRLKARYQDYGGWQRPEYYPLDGESRRKAILRESRAVRTAVGVFDNSPLGKIEVRGPDAAEFLNRIYVNPVHNLAVGRSRYGLMLNENGVIIDDGVCSRMGGDLFLVNTTSAGASRIVSHFEEWLQCEWPGFRVLVDDVTHQWANFTLAGPQARPLLQSLGGSIDLSSDALPHMAVASGEIAGESVRLLRVSFSGETSFEINLPANRANNFFARVMHAGIEFGLCPYGVEALMVLRLEKGYLHVGSDTDGETTPDDVGWGHVAHNKHADFIGKRSLSRPANQDSNRKQLVGLIAENRTQVIRAGGHLLKGRHRRTPAMTDGWITSAAWSPHLERYIALAMLRSGRSHTGKPVTVIDQHKAYSATVVTTPFFDANHERLRK